MSDIFKGIIESREFGEEFFVAEFQSRLANMLDNKGISRAELARKLGVSRARVSQIFSDEASNFTLRLLFRSFCALDEEPVITTKKEHDRLKKRAEANSQAVSNHAGSRSRDAGDGLTTSLIAELLRANIHVSGADQEKPSRRNDSTRRWAESGPNVVPFRERAYG